MYVYLYIYIKYIYAYECVFVLICKYVCVFVPGFVLVQVFINNQTVICLTRSQLTNKYFNY